MSIRKMMVGTTELRVQNKYRGLRFEIRKQGSMTHFLIPLDLVEPFLGMVRAEMDARPAWERLRQERIWASHGLAYQEPGS